MGFCATSPAPRKCDPTAKNRVWGFFGDEAKTSRKKPPQSLQPRQGNRPNTTRIASGLSFWPSRDPIGSVGGPKWFKRFSDAEQIRNQIDSEASRMDRFFSANPIGSNSAVLLSGRRKTLHEFLYKPSELRSEVNLYSMLSNDAVGKVDVLGLHDADDCDRQFDQCNAGCGCLATKFQRFRCFTACQLEYSGCLATTDTALGIYAVGAAAAAGFAVGGPGGAALGGLAAAGS